MEDDFALRYARIYAGVNSRAELVTLATGLYKWLGDYINFHPCHKRAAAAFESYEFRWAGLGSRLWVRLSLGMRKTLSSVIQLQNVFLK